MAEALAYLGRDLESMSFARNYHRWILDLFAPHLGRRVVEVGAGTGSFSELLLARGPESLTLVEPSGEMHRLLVARVGRLPARARPDSQRHVRARRAPPDGGGATRLGHLRQRARARRGRRGRVAARRRGA